MLKNVLLAILGGGSSVAAGVGISKTTGNTQEVTINLTEVVKGIEKEAEQKDKEVQEWLKGIIKTEAQKLEGVISSEVNSTSMVYTITKEALESQAEDSKEMMDSISKEVKAVESAITENQGILRTVVVSEGMNSSFGEEVKEFIQTAEEMAVTVEKNEAVVAAIEVLSGIKAR